MTQDIGNNTFHNQNCDCVRCNPELKREADPDFEQLARRVIALIDSEAEAYVPEDELARKAVAEQQAAVAELLRQVWNHEPI